MRYCGWVVGELTLWSLALSLGKSLSRRTSFESGG